jgi:hypothetical protein
MEKLSIEVTDSPRINSALGISSERSVEIAESIASVIDEIIEAGPEREEPVRITDFAKRAIDKIQPQTANELFYIGVKFGEIVEQNATHGAMQAMLQSIMPSEADLARSILRSTGEGN